MHRTGGVSSHQASSVNWGMVMARRTAGAGRVGLRTMLSAEPWTVGDCGFINFFATGEMCGGDTIHDRQHPHDLVMELAADYSRPLTSSLRWQIYGGVAGEPALGPPAFPHRLSAAFNPIAPIGHHWIDSTHIAYGVITTGLETRRMKAEGSIFNGREPDERRTDLDLARLDSYSGRFTFMPTSRLALQVSGGHLEQAEAQFAPDPRTDVERVTASATSDAIGRRGGPVGDDAGLWPQLPVDPHAGQRHQALVGGTAASRAASATGAAPRGSGASNSWASRGTTCTRTPSPPRSCRPRSFRVGSSARSLGARRQRESAVRSPSAWCRRSSRRATTGGGRPGSASSSC